MALVKTATITVLCPNCGKLHPVTWPKKASYYLCLGCRCPYTVHSHNLICKVKQGVSKFWHPSVAI